MIRKVIDDKHYLEIEAAHRDGAYRVYFTQYTRVDDSGLVEMYPFAEGNFTVKMGLGRKSEKKLNKIRNYLEDKSDSIFLLWQDKQYQGIADSLFSFWHSLG